MQHIGTVLRPIQERIERATAERETFKKQRITEGIARHGWSEDAACWICGDTGTIPERSIPGSPYYCNCDAGVRAEAEATMTPPERAWANAGIPERHREFRLETALDPDAANDARLWINREPIRLGGGLAISGPTGVGKTAIAVSAMHELVSTGLSRRPLFRGCGQLFQDLRASIDDDKRSEEPRTIGYDRIISQCQTADLLLLDDIGQTRGSDWEREILESIFTERNGAKRPTIITTNLEEEDLKKNVGGRSVSRMLQDATIVFMDGVDRRRKVAS